MKSARTGIRTRLAVWLVAPIALFAVGCSGNSASGPELVEVKPPTQIEAVDVGDLDSQEPFDDTQMAGPLPDVRYEFAGDLALPSQNFGYVYRSGGGVDDAMLKRLAEYFGLDADQVQNWDEFAAAQPDQSGADAAQLPTAGLGYSPTAALQQWTYADYELSDPYRNCQPLEPGASVPAGSVSSGSVSGSASSDPGAASGNPESCVAPEPAGTPPTGPEAEQKLSGMLEQIGVEHGRLSFQTYADNYTASTNAVELDGDGLRTGREWSATYGAGGVVISAMGPFAVPERVGPYDLVDLATAEQRVASGVNSFGGMGAAGGAATPNSSPTTDSSGDATTVKIVSVSPDLFWIWDAEDNAWLVPAYAFADAQGGVWSVPAVPDDLFVSPAG